MTQFDMICEQWLATIVPPRRTTSSVTGSEAGPDEASLDAAGILYGSEIAIDYGPIRLRLSRFEFVTQLLRSARSCRALNPSPSNLPGILQIVRAINEFSQIVQLRVGTSRTRRMLQSIKK